LALRRLCLALVDRGLALRLLDLLLDRGDLGRDRGAPGIEELLLRIDQCLDRRFGRPLQQLPWERDLVETRSFAFEPGDDG
jgi:hypothetical protein